MAQKLIIKAHIPLSGRNTYNSFMITKIIYNKMLFNFGNRLYLQTSNGNVEAKVICFYRRRDISSSLLLLADKHASKSFCYFTMCMLLKFLVDYLI